MKRTRLHTPIHAEASPHFVDYGVSRCGKLIDLQVDLSDELQDALYSRVPHELCWNIARIGNMPIPPMSTPNLINTFWQGFISEKARRETHKTP